MLQNQHWTSSSDIGLSRSENNYSPTSPLATSPTSEITTPVPVLPSTYPHQSPLPRPVRLTNPITAPMFTGKRRRDNLNTQSQSLESFFQFGGDEFQARFKRQKKRLEDWDAKGGFNIVGSQTDDEVRSKAITDLDMATMFGVVPETSLFSPNPGKRVANASPSQHISHWTQKKSKKSAPTHVSETQELATMESDMLVHLSLTVGCSKNALVRDVVDPNQPQQSL